MLTPFMTAPLRILLAEDNLVNQKIAIRHLERLGFATDVVDDGQAVLEAVAHRAYDVILMDVQMPVMDGLEATRTLRARLSPDRQPVIIALTASDSPKDRQACLDAGMDNFLLKPFRSEALEATLAAYGGRAS